MEFTVSETRDPSLERDTILRFLNSIDANQLASEALDSMGWGDGDPINIAFEILKKRASEWS